LRETARVFATNNPVEVKAMAASNNHKMRCMEVWGGNRAADVGVAMTGLDAWVYSRPHGETATGGGDVHYVSSCASGSITRLLLADVSGHGRAVAQIATSLRDLMRRHVNRVSQDRVIKGINRQFAQVGDAGLFATALVFTFFAPQQRLTLSNAGHPPPLVYRHREKTWAFIESDGHSDSEALANLPLGVIEEMHFHQHETHLAGGDLVLCYSDALIEAIGPGGKPIGAAGLHRLVRQLPIGEPEAMIRDLLRRIDALDPDNLDRDDLTVLLFRRDPAATRINLGRLLAAPVRLAGAKLAAALAPGRLGQSL
jgi:serine phosphatase RsbU (regulator of sigma subunit)